MSGAKSSYVAPRPSAAVQERARRAREAADRAERERQEAAARAEAARRERERQEEERRRVEAERRRQRQLGAVAEASGARTGATSFSRRVHDDGEPEVPQSSAREPQAHRAEQQTGHRVDPAPPPAEDRTGGSGDPHLPSVVPTVPDSERRVARISEILARSGVGWDPADDPRGGLLEEAARVDDLQSWEGLQVRARRAVDAAAAAADEAAQASAAAASAAAQAQEGQRLAAEQAEQAAQAESAERSEVEELLGSIDGLSSSALDVVRSDLEGVLRGDDALDDQLRARVDGARRRAEELVAERAGDQRRAYELLASLGDLESVVLDRPRRELEAVISGDERLSAELEERVERARDVATREQVAAVLREMGVQLVENPTSENSWTGVVDHDAVGGASLVILDEQGLSLVATHPADLTDEDVLEVERRNCALADAVDDRVARAGVEAKRYQDLRPGELARPAAPTTVTPVEDDSIVTTGGDEADRSERDKRRKRRADRSATNRRTT